MLEEGSILGQPDWQKFIMTHLLRAVFRGENGEMKVSTGALVTAIKDKDDDDDAEDDEEDDEFDTGEDK